mmetsp:Transcript_8177/g.12850  ORF Transcript_8177/g.12850 Transcript_8177/m.12850 type:complete len:292 (+) Transcript_8177:970-1845(+)
MRHTTSSTRRQGRMLPPLPPPPRTSRSSTLTSPSTSTSTSTRPTPPPPPLHTAPPTTAPTPSRRWSACWSRTCRTRTAEESPADLASAAPPTSSPPAPAFAAPPTIRVPAATAFATAPATRALAVPVFAAGPATLGAMPRPTPPPLARAKPDARKRHEATRLLPHRPVCRGRARALPPPSTSLTAMEEVALPPTPTHTSPSSSPTAATFQTLQGVLQRRMTHIHTTPPSLLGWRLHLAPFPHAYRTRLYIPTHPSHSSTDAHVPSLSATINSATHIRPLCTHTGLGTKAVS